jgi:hypothetical protein
LVVDARDLPIEGVQLLGVWPDTAAAVQRHRAAIVEDAATGAAGRGSGVSFSDGASSLEACADGNVRGGNRMSSDPVVVVGAGPTDVSKKLLGRAAIALCLMLPVAVARAPAASAIDPSPSNLADLCRQADASGALDWAGVTRGECVNGLTAADPPSLSSNNDDAGICGWDAFQFLLGTTTKGQCIQVLDPSSHRPFTATLVESLNENGFTVSGSGTASRMAAVSETGTIEGIDIENFPASAVFYVTSTITADKGDQIFVYYQATLTDTASPPAGENYSESGYFGITGGTGRFTGARGRGSIAGACTSSFGDPVARCDSKWTGTIGF